MRLILGDCLKVLPTLESDSVDMAFTSPPYNRKRNDAYEKYDDILDDYHGMLCYVTDELLRISKGLVFVNVQANYYNTQEEYQYFADYKDAIKTMFCWTKTNPKPSAGKAITNAYEYIVCLSRKTRKLEANSTYTKNVITTSVNTKTTTKTHKAVMNQEVADFFIERFTKQGDIVLDPFSGLATTGVACLSRGRDYIGIELCKEYMDEGIRRLGLFGANLNVEDFAVATRGD